MNSIPTPAVVHAANAAPRPGAIARHFPTFLLWFWLARLALTNRKLGVVYWNVCAKDNAVPWMVLRDVNAQMLNPAPRIPWNEEVELERQNQVLDNYIRQFNLSKSEVSALHRAYSPYKIPEGLPESAMRQIVNNPSLIYG